ncbi:MAG: GNAT family N-acetyltransferase [Bacteroidia bacterium]
MIRFQPITDADLPFLNKLYASTREEELSVTGWSSKEKTAFLDQQFHAQHTFYQEQFAKARFDIIIQDQTPIGRRYIEVRSDEIRLIDIALLPAYRGQGIGKTLMEQVLDEGRMHNLPVRIHVEQHNPAMRLYTRLGFEKIGDTGVYFLMEWKP